MGVLHDVAKHGCGHRGAVYRAWIRLKRRRLAIPASGFIVDLTIGGAPSDAVSMVVVMTIHAAAKVVELFVQTLVLQMALFVDSGVVHIQNDEHRIQLFTIHEHRGRNLIPVLVFIHGESFEWNAGNPYDGSVLASYGKVVAITVNFRLGVFGFLPIMEGSARGNYGITDLIAALHWIQENIAQFGGDSKNVTLLGQGHGAALVHFLVLSPMTKGSSLFPLGLFHRAIMLSGSALSPWAIAREANQYAQKLSSTLECPINDPAITLECLRQRSVSDILGVDIKVPTFLSGFGPTIDGIVIQGEPETLLEVQSEEYPIDSIEVMFGISKSTSYFQVTQQEESEGFGIGRRDKLLRTLVRNIFSYHLQEIFLTIINEYTDWSKTPQHNVNVLESTLDALGDALFVAPVIRAANYHSEGQSVVYFYVFNYQTEGDKYLEKQRCFCEALEYIFGTPVLGYPGYLPKNFSDNERIFSEAVMTYLINFVKSG
nr:neuroligin-1-like [Parasteatoda tepidariorum]